MEGLRGLVGRLTVYLSVKINQEVHCMLTKLNCDSVNGFLEACQGRYILGERPNGNDCQFYQLEIEDKSYGVCVSGQKNQKLKTGVKIFIVTC